MRGFFICFFIFPWKSREAKRDYAQRWSKQLLSIFNVRVKNNFSSLPSGGVIVSNHVSWLDIFVINSVAPSHFVAKADIRSWPLLGKLAAMGGTIFISRGSKSDLKRIYQDLIHRIETGERVAFFPEGTTAAPGELLPFHANLFEAPIRSKTPVQPIALRYLNEEQELHPAIDYSGDVTFGTSLVNVLNAGEIHAELHCLELISSEMTTRRELAATTYDAIALVMQVETPESR